MVFISFTFDVLKGKWFSFTTPYKIGSAAVGTQLTIEPPGNSHWLVLFCFVFPTRLLVAVKVKKMGCAVMGIEESMDWQNFRKPMRSVNGDTLINSFKT